MRLAVIVAHVRQVFAGNAEHYRVIEVSDGDQHGPGVADSTDASRRQRLDPEYWIAGFILAVNRRDRLLESDLQLIRVDDFPIVAKRLDTGRLVEGRHERKPADFQQLGGR